MADAGVEFYVGDLVHGSCLDITIYDIPSFVEDKFEFFANLYNVNVEQLKSYREFLSDRQCTAITKSKRRCKHQADLIGGVAEFEYGKSTLCIRHKKDFLLTKNA